MCLQICLNHPLGDFLSFSPTFHTFFIQPVLALVPLLVFINSSNTHFFKNLVNCFLFVCLSMSIPSLLMQIFFVFFLDSLTVAAGYILRLVIIIFLHALTVYTFLIALTTFLHCHMINNSFRLCAS